MEFHAQSGDVYMETFIIFSHANGKISYKMRTYVNSGLICHFDHQEVTPGVNLRNQVHADDEPHTRTEVETEVQNRTEDMSGFTKRLKCPRNI